MGYIGDIFCYLYSFNYPFFLRFSLIDLQKASTTIINKKDEIGSPCLIPLEILNNPLRLLLIKIDILRVEIQLKMMFTNWCENPNTSKDLDKNLQSTISQAFLMSSFMSMHTSLLYCAEWIVSWMVMIPFGNDLRRTKPIFSSNMSLGRTLFSLSGRAFDKILSFFWFFYHKIIKLYILINSNSFYLLF